MAKNIFRVCVAPFQSFLSTLEWFEIRILFSQSYVIIFSDPIVPAYGNMFCDNSLRLFFFSVEFSIAYTIFDCLTTETAFQSASTLTSSPLKRTHLAYSNALLLHSSEHIDIIHLREDRTTAKRRGTNQVSCITRVIDLNQLSPQISRIVLVESSSPTNLITTRHLHFKNNNFCYL